MSDTKRLDNVLYLDQNPPTRKGQKWKGGVVVKIGKWESFYNKVKGKKVFIMKARWFNVDLTK